MSAETRGGKGRPENRNPIGLRRTDGTAAVSVPDLLGSRTIVVLGPTSKKTPSGEIRSLPKNS